MKFKSFLAVVAPMAALLAGLSPASAYVINFDFNQPALASGAFEYAAGFTGYSSNGLAATTPGVTYNGMSGVQTNGSGWGFPNAPAGGAQTAFIQWYGGAPSTPGSLTFDIAHLSNGDRTTLSFYDIARPGYGDEPFTVTYGGKLLGTFTPTNTWTEYSVSFASVHGDNLVFLGAINPNDGRDSGAGVYGVSVSAVPEPATWAMLMVGFAGLGFAGYRRGKGERAAVAA